MKTLEKSLIISFLFAIILNFTVFANNCDNLSKKVLRLHIIANSDCKADQNLKLKIRDKIIEESGEILDNAENKTSAKEIILKNLESINSIALKEIKSQGFDYSVKTEIVNMYFPTKKYGEVIFPAGKYDALRISIGRGKGQNWWCVIFPQLCLGSAKKSANIDTVLSNSEKEVINNSEKYEIKFKFVEWFYAIKDYISKIGNFNHS